MDMIDYEPLKRELLFRGNMDVTVEKESLLD